ncbi:MAG: PP2C family protein-serine/threonine phosphatase [Candidatus Acidiferrales bacterium]
MRFLSPKDFVFFLRRTSTLDRVVIAGLVLFALLRLTDVFERSLSLSFFFGLLGLAAFVYLCVRLSLWLRARLLWSLRNRLIVAYIFIAVVPVILLMTMMGIGLYLLYPQIGAHLLRDGLQDRVNIITGDAETIASAVAQEVRPGQSPIDQSLLSAPAVVSLINAAKTEWPGLRVFLHRARLVNPAMHGQFAGLVEYRGQLLFASEQERESASGPVVVLVGAPITPAILDGLTTELGPIRFTLLKPADQSSKGIPLTIGGHSYVSGEQIVSNGRVLPRAASWLDIPIGGAATFEAYHSETDPNKAASSAPSITPVLATFSLRPSTLSRSLFSSVGAVGPILVDIVIVAAAIFLLLEIGALGTGIVLTRTITRSVGDLYDATLHVARGDFAHRVRVTQRDQLGALGESFNEMTSSITNLIEEQRQRQRLEHEVAIASEVQQLLFPKSLPSLPGLELAAICRPARVVSGDYYDFIRLNPSSIAIALADISGKGIFAALLMASLQAALRSTATLDGAGDTARLVSRLNTHLFKNTSDDRYATLFYATYDSETRTLTYTNAGHLPPFFITDGCLQQLDHGGTVVGLFENPAYEQVKLQVAPGTILVAFSDGVTEPENVFGEEFGVQRLKDEVLRNRNMSAQCLAERIIATAERWAGTAEQADDMTIVVARMG